MSEKGVHVVHTIGNGAIADEDGEDQRVGRKMSADSVGETYLWLHGQKPCLWTHEREYPPSLPSISTRRVIPHVGNCRLTHGVYSGYEACV